MKPVGWTGISPYPEVERPSAQREAASSFEQTLDGFLDKPVCKKSADVENVSDPVRFSRHAQARLQSRGIELSPHELEGLEKAFDELNRRGAKESLVLMGERAFVVGVRTKAVITVFDRAEALGTVFTNIDSTYVAS